MVVVLCVLCDLCGEKGGGKLQVASGDWKLETANSRLETATARRNRERRAADTEATRADTSVLSESYECHRRCASGDIEARSWDMKATETDGMRQFFRRGRRGDRVTLGAHRRHIEVA